MGREFLLSSTVVDLIEEGAVVELLEVTVTDIRVSADIGIYPHEMRRRQSLKIDVTLTLAPAFGSCEVTTVDYAAIVAAAVALADERTELIEGFARRLADTCITFPLVQAAAVTVVKPEALDNGVASIRLVLSRVSPYDPAPR